MIELDGQNAYYGFYIERGDASMNRDDTWDWTRLWKALQERSSLLETIAAIETSHAVRFLGRGGRAGESYHLSDSLEKGGSALWDDREPWRLTVAERIRRLAEADADDWVEIYLVGVTPKAEAISAGVQVAHQIANTMKGMLPIYTAAVRG